MMTSRKRKQKQVRKESFFVNLMIDMNSICNVDSETKSKKELEQEKKKLAEEEKKRKQEEREKVKAAAKQKVKEEKERRAREKKEMQEKKKSEKAETPRRSMMTNLTKPRARSRSVNALMTRWARLAWVTAK